MKKVSLKLKTYSIWILVGVVVLSVISYNLILRRAKVTRELAEEGKFRLREVSIDLEKGEIYFKGKVQKTEGWVQFLIYLRGYKWLKEESAIVSDAKLADLQKAIALLDWKLWDELWHRKTDEGLSLSIKWDREEVKAQELVLAEDRLRIGDFVFLGSPYFDQIALEAPPGVDCKLCPVFPLEKKVLSELFVRESGRSGYELNPERMPAQGIEVTIVIKKGDSTLECSIGKGSS